MIPIQLTEYRSDGNDYPILVILGEGTRIHEAELKAAGPHIIGETKTLGKGSLIVQPFNQVHVTVRETVADISKIIRDELDT
jgi:hypothetical protein